MTPKAVIFDIGNVLLNWHPERLYDQVMSKDARRKMFAEVNLHDMNDRIDKGANWRDTVYETAETYPQYRDLIRLWHDRWAEMATPIIPESWSMLRALRTSGVPVFALSNFGVESFAYAETLYPELAEFDQRYISGHMRVTKPDPKIYEMVEIDCGLTGADLFFIDDRQDNIEAAAARGWQTHLFERPKGLAVRLSDMGLISQS